MLLLVKGIASLPLRRRNPYHSLLSGSANISLKQSSILKNHIDFTASEKLGCVDEIAVYRTFNLQRLSKAYSLLSISVLLRLIVSRFAALLVTRVSSIVTNLLDMASVLAAAGIWMFQLDSDYDTYIMIGFGFFLPGSPNR